MKVQAIIPSAGSGVRLKSSVSKPFVELNGKPIFLHTLEAFSKCSSIKSVILVVEDQYRPQFQQAIEHNKFTVEIKLAEGGKTRQESVSNGLKYVDEDTDIVVVHDAARPLIEPALIEEAIRLCQDEEAVIVAVPVKPTIKKVNPKTMAVEQTLDRQQLWEVQTPQVFKREVLKRAHNQDFTDIPTDCAMMAEQLGVSVKVLPGSYKNIKITTQEDLVIARSFLEK